MQLNMKLISYYKKSMTLFELYLNNMRYMQQSKKWRYV